MVSFPNCKINLGLKILRKRADGYHHLSTVFYPLPVKDVLEIIRAPSDGITPSGDAPPSPSPAFIAYGLPIPGTGNLCEKAYQLLKNDFPSLPTVQIHLYKNIPIGAGLGGGSADGAFTLRALDQKFQLKLSPAQLLQYATQLGSDCPFFILNTPCLGGGRGEQLTPIPLDLSAYTFVLADPGVHISTAEAFTLCTPAEETIPLKDIINQPIHRWKELLHNDFEAPIFRLHPHLEKVKDTLYAHGALYASLTGSGSSFFGIFKKHQAPPALPFSGNYRILP